MSMESVEIIGLSGERIVKTPGSINGASVVIKDLHDCQVYILDHSAEVDVSGVETCSIFIGPVDGPAIFDNISGSKIAVAAQQFQGRNIFESEISLHTVTVPSLSNSENVVVGCWQGAYPGLIQHFRAANLDPLQNKWQELQDISPEESFVPRFTLSNNNDPWVVPLEGSGLPENPVPFGAGIASANGSSNPFGSDSLAAPAPINGHLDEADFTEPTGEHPKMKEINDRLAERQQSQQASEQAVKSELVSKANAYLEKFYAERQKKLANRAKSNRDTEQSLPAGGIEGNTEWEKAVNLVDFGFARPNGTDLSRFKNVLFSAKSKNVPQSSKFGA